MPESHPQSPVEVPSLALEDESQLGIEEQRQFLLHNLITGFKFAKEVMSSPRKSFAGIDESSVSSPTAKRSSPASVQTLIYLQFA
jgi:hypothetical protein